MMTVTAWLAFMAGLLSFVSPCVLPLVPAYVGYMGNRVTAQVTTTLVVASGPSIQPAQQNRLQMALHGMAFVAGFMVVFVGFGLAINAGTQLVSSTFYDVQRVFIPRLGGILIILFGLHFVGLVVLALGWIERRPALDRLGSLGAALRRGLAWLQQILYADTRHHIRPDQRYGLFSSGLMGIIFAAGWTPCIGPIYGTILTMASSSSVVQAGGLMVMYSLGLGVPFVLTAMALDRVQGVLRRLKRHLHALKIASGVFMIVIGVLVYTGDMQRLSQLGAANATFSYKLEGCAVDVVEGRLALSQVGDCLSKPDVQKPAN
jgi:cytochrome c-type biogenesis protein